MIKALIVILFFSIVVASSIFVLYNSFIHKEDISTLDIEEKNIFNRYGVTEKKFRFCSDPLFEPLSSRIMWDETQGYSDNKCLKLIFDNDKMALGIHFYLSLALHPYLEKGIFEFWLKGKNDYYFIKSLNISFLKVPIIQKIDISLPIKITKEWQKISLPLNNFLLSKEDKDRDFSYEIQEILFSIDVSNEFSNNKVELFIDGLRIINENKIIYELF